MSTGFHKFLPSSKFRGQKKPISWAAVSAFFSCPLSNGDVRKQQLQVCYWSCSVEAREGSEAQSSEEEESGDHCGRGIQFHWRSLDVFSDHPFSEPLLAGWQWENEGHLLIESCFVLDFVKMLKVSECCANTQLITNEKAEHERKSRRDLETTSSCIPSVSSHISHCSLLLCMTCGLIFTCTFVLSTAY